MKTVWINLLLAATVLLAGCATHSSNSSGQNQFYGEVKTGYEASHTSH